MSDGAKLQSPEALLEAKAALTAFAHEVAAALAGVDAEVMRTGHWLQQERPAFWKSEIRRREDEVGAARREIERKVIAAAPEPASTVLERKHLDACKRRVDSAREKQENVRRWAARWEREAMMYKGASTGLAEFVGGDLQRAVERLERLASLIDDYTHIAPPTAEQTGVSLEALAAATTPPSAGGPHASDDDLARALLLLREEDLPTLRTLGPDAEQRARLATVPIPVPFLRAPAFHADDAAELARLEIFGDLPPADAPVAVAWNSLASPALFLARAPDEPAINTSSDASAHPGVGWILSTANDPRAPGGWFSVTLADLLAARGDLEPLFRLAPGAVAVLAGGRLRWVLNALNHHLWTPRH